MLSFDHKPNNDEERKRITAAGGWVEFNRVNGKRTDCKKILRVRILNIQEIWLYPAHSVILSSNAIPTNEPKSKSLLVRN